jgi:hypothetical protein
VKSVAALVAVLGAAWSFPSAAQIGAINAAPPGPRTGLIVGQVVDGATGEPVTDAIVRLAMPKYSQELPTTPQGRVMTDGEGRFFFSELPSGDYYLQATKDGHVPGSYGQRYPRSQGQSVTLAEGERRADIQLRVWKFAVIGGSVVDEAGEPVVGVAVRAMVRGVIAGRTRYGNMELVPELVPATTTDDRGMFRLSQLTPATYVVVVPSTHTTVPVSFSQKPITSVRNELFAAGVHEITPLGQSGTVQLGDFAVMTPSRVLIPPPPTPAGRMQVYRSTYYPASTTAAAASPIAVIAGEERTDLTITLRPVPAVRLSGRLVTPNGLPPPPMTIRLVGESMIDVTTSVASVGPSYVGLETAIGVTDAQGRFMLAGVPAGDYVLSQANPFLSRALWDDTPAYWLAFPLAVGNEDVSDLAVQLRPALRVEGRVELRHESTGDAPAPSRPPGVMFQTPFSESGQFAVGISQDTMSFATLAAGGQFIVRPYELGGWFVKSVTLDGKDITDRVFDLQGDVTSLVITYTDRPSPVTGAVTDSNGAARGTAVVLAFPADRQRWSGYGSVSRIFKSALTNRSGVYTIDHLPPGEYCVVAVEGAEAEGWQHPERLEALAALATTVSVAAGDASRTIDLRLRVTP